MNANPAAIVPAGLGTIRRHLRLTLKEVADQLGVSPKTLARWEQGTGTPSTQQIIGYATLTHRRIMVGRNRIGRYNLAELLPHMAKFRKAHKLTQEQLAGLLHVTGQSVGELEQQSRDGKRTGWAPTVRYMAALGWEIGTSPLETATETVTVLRPRSTSPTAHGGSWETRAACTGWEDKFFLPWYQTRHPDVKTAKAICRTCPVLDNCRQFTQAHPWWTSDGIWAAMTPSERRRAHGRYQYERTAA